MVNKGPYKTTTATATAKSNRFRLAKQQLCTCRVIGRLGIVAKWFERIRSVFFSEVFMDVAVVGS